MAINAETISGLVVIGIAIGGGIGSALKFLPKSKKTDAGDEVDNKNSESVVVADSKASPYLLESDFLKLCELRHNPINDTLVRLEKRLDEGNKLFEELRGYMFEHIQQHAKV